MKGANLRHIISFLLLTFLLASSAAQASSLCPHPQDNRPALSFSLLSFRPGDLDRDCGPFLTRARALGFTAVTLIPTFTYNRAEQRLVRQPSLGPGELSRCLDLIAQAGMDLVYQPHLDAIETVTGEGEAGWRALFDVHPNVDYGDIVFAEYLRWLTDHSGDVRAEGSPRSSVVISAELERSVQLHPGEWIKFLRDLRLSLSAAGLNGLVPLGINPNWNPWASSERRQNCAAFRRLIAEIDFIAPSMYGDWSHTPLGPQQVDERIAMIRDNLANQFRGQCVVSEFLQRPLFFGEFGVGRDLHSAEMRLPAVQSDHFIQQRRMVYGNLLTWARGFASASSPATVSQPISIWTLGIFDPVGINPNQNEVMADQDIAQMFRDYTLDRCPNIVMPPLPAMAALQESIVTPAAQAPLPILTRLRILLKPLLENIRR